MKNTPQILATNRRLESDPRASRRGPSFFRISDDYFAHEAPRSSAIDAGVFTALIVCAMLPIANGLQAVAILVHSISVL